MSEMGENVFDMDLSGPVVDSNLYTVKGEWERKASIVEMERTINYFMQKKPLYDEYDMINNQAIPKTYNHFSTVRTLAVTSIVIVILCYLMIGCVGVIFALLQDSYQLWIGLILLTLLAVVIVAGCIAACVFFFRMLKKKRDSLAERSNEIASELEAYYRDFGYCVVGMEYTNPAILYRIYNMIRQGRADTPKEALNNLIQDRHRQLMELRAAQTARYARAAASNANTAAWFCAASFILK